MSAAEAVQQLSASDLQVEVEELGTAGGLWGHKKKALLCPGCLRLPRAGGCCRHVLMLCEQWVYVWEGSW